VGIYSLACEIRTIYASTKEEAISLVGENHGRHAGVEGPEVIGVGCIAADSDDSTHFIGQWLANQQRILQQLQQQDKKIIVPQLKPPTDIIVPGG
jgi:hypothetical protein